MKKVHTENSLLDEVIPHEFVIDYLGAENCRVSPMSGCYTPMSGDYTISVDGKYMLLLREREDVPEDNGVWIATVNEHHDSLLKDIPILQPIQDFGPKITGWMVIPEAHNDFEKYAFKACDLIMHKDKRIGRETLSLDNHTNGH